MPELVVQIGGIPITLRNASPTFEDVLRRRNAAFITKARLAGAIILNMEESPPRGELAQQVSVQRTFFGWHLERSDFEVDVCLHEGIGQLRIVDPNVYTTDTVFRLTHTVLAVQSCGFLLHAASVVRNDRAFIFTGLSGAGKTTISRLAPPDARLLTDEISYIRPLDGTYTAFGTPFAGEMATPGENIKAPIESVYILAQGRENRIDTVDSGEAMRKLMRNVLFFSQDAELTNMVFQSVCDFVARVPIRRLTFVPDPRVWELIR